ncbi:hypothetical protein LY76DRAFT_236299, partial [Colletotrichum caudatum]
GGEREKARRGRKLVIHGRQVFPNRRQHGPSHHITKPRHKTTRDLMPPLLLPSAAVDGEYYTTTTWLDIHTGRPGAFQGWPVDGPRGPLLCA